MCFKKRAIPLAIFLLLFMIPRSVSANTLTVCSSGCSYTKIQDALNAAKSYDTVQVLSTYDSISAGENFPVTLTVQNFVTITGQVDSKGNPITTVDISPSTTTPTHDGFIVVTDGFTISNLRIVDSSSAVGDIHRAIASGSFIPGRTHGLGLTVQNVLIDLRGTNGFHGGNGLDLMTDTVTIEGNTIQGTAGSAMSLDGNNFLIRNNQVNGVNGAGTVLANFGIAFGDDVPGPPCSGYPKNYTITGNTIDGVLTDGVVFCNGIGISIVGNTIRDAGSTAINSAGSQNVFVSRNSLSWSRIAGQTGIGFSQSQSVIIADNSVLGRPAKDLNRGIVLGGCSNCQILRNNVQNLGSDAIIFAMSAGASTGSLIDENIEQNANGNGIAYLGSDTGSTKVDSTIVRNNVAENNQQNGIIVGNVKGTGGAITGNQARSNNLGGLSNTHGFNLQNLAGTLIDGNQAFNTRGTGYGFFLANSQSLSGGCNLGSGNGGGFLYQTAVNPTFTNPSSTCRPGVITGGTNGWVNFYTSSGLLLGYSHVGGVVNAVALAKTQSSWVAVSGGDNGWINGFVGTTSPTWYRNVGGNVTTIAVSIDGSTVASGGSNGWVNILTSSGSSQSYFNTGFPVNKVAISPDGTLIASASNGGWVNLYSKSGSSFVSSWWANVGGNALSVTVVSPATGTYVIVGNSNGVVTCFSASSSIPLWTRTVGGQVVTVDSATRPVTNTAVIAVGASNGWINIFNETGANLGYYGTGGPVNSVSVYWAGGLVATISANGWVNVLNVPSNGPVALNFYAYPGGNALSGSGLSGVSGVSVGSSNGWVNYYTVNSTPVWYSMPGGQVVSVSSR